MKRIFIIFFIFIGIYLLFNANIWEMFKFGGKTDEISINGVQLIDIDISGAHATIIPEKGNTVRAEVSNDGKVNIAKSGKSVKVTYEPSGLKLFQFGNGPKVKIYIPQDYNKDMNMATGSGLISFTSPSKTMEIKNLNVELGSGKIDLENLQLKDFSFNGSSGIINIDKLITKRGSISINSGVVSVNHYQGKLDAKVTSGLLHIQMDELNDDILMKVGSGQLKLDLPDDADFKLKSNIGSGLLKCDYPLNNRVQEKKEISGTHGTGEHDLKISVSSGLVSIY